jgi:hypothetical protein
MNRDETASIVAVILLGLALAIGVFRGLWSMTSVLEYMPYFIVGAILSVFVWGFRERIDAALNPIKLVVTEPDWGQPVNELHIRFREGSEKVCKGQFYFVKLINQGRQAVEKLQFFTHEAGMRMVLLTADPTARHCITADYKGSRYNFESALEKDDKLPFIYGLLRSIDSDRAVDEIEELLPDEKHGVTFLLAFALEGLPVVWLPCNTKRYYNIPCKVPVALQCWGRKLTFRVVAKYEIIAPTKGQSSFDVKRVEQSKGDS